MPEAGKTPDVFRFGPFELSVETGELRNHGRRVGVGGQPIKVLTLLVKTPGKLVTREELQRQIWPGSSYGDFEAGLNAAVARLRAYLDDSATDPTYIETIPGRGYRFIATRQFRSDTNEFTAVDNVIPIVPTERKWTSLDRSPSKSAVEDNVNEGRGGDGAATPPSFKTTRYDTVPPLPQNFVPRPAELESLRQALLGDRENRQVALVALREMGGVGKTVLAQALCRDRDIQTAFPDGVIWIKVGQKPTEADLVNQMREAARVIGVSPQGFDTLDGSSKLLRSLLKDKIALLVLDDVWEAAPVYYFQPADDSRFCRLLFTTRDDEIAATVGARSHPLDLLDERLSRHLLAAYAAVEEKTLPQEADGILRECHGLPLALAMIGAMLRSKSPQHWADVLHNLRNADIDAIKIKFPNYAYPSLVAAIETSFNSLEDTERRCYLDFAVFPEDTAVSDSALEIAWGLDGKHVRQYKDRLVSLSLATRDDHGKIVLHDLQLDYVRSRAGSGLRDLHRRLLERYEKKCSNGWYSGPNDGYFFEHLAYHMREAGQPRDLRNLLFDYMWLEKRLHVSGVAALLGDFDIAAYGRFTKQARGMFPGRALNVPPWRIVERASAFSQHPLDVSGEEAIEPLRILQSALLLSAHVLAKDPKQLAGQLWGRLPQNKLDFRIAGLRNEARKSDNASLLPIYPSLTPPGGPLLRMFTGHTASVNGVAVTPDGTRIVSASEDQRLKVWELASGRELLTLGGHSSDVYAVAITPDGRYVVSASEDKSLRVWDLASGREVLTLRGHTSSITGVAITPDGRLAVSACWDQTLKVWDLQAGREIHSLKGHSRFISAVAVTPDGRFAVSASHDKTLKVWDLVTGLELRTLNGHSEWVSAVAITPDGTCVVSASGDQTLKVWKLENGQEIQTLVGHTKAVSAVAITPDGRCAVSGSYDQSLKVWDLVEGYELGTLGSHSHWVNAVAITPDGKRTVSGSVDMTLKVWEFAAGPGLRTQNGHSGGVGSVAVTTGGKRAVSASADMTLKVWHIGNGRVKHTLTGHGGRVNSVALVPDSNIALSASDDTTVKVWDISSGHLVQTLIGHTNTVRAVAVEPSGRFAVSGSRDQTVRVWDLVKGREIHKLTGHTGGVYTIALTPDGKWALSGSSDRTLKVWDLAGGRELFTLNGHTGRVTAVTVTPDGRRALSASRDRTVKLWDLASGRELDTLISASGFITQVAIIPGSELGTVISAPELITQVAISPDGELAVSGYSDKTLRVWKLASGTELAVFTLDAAPECCAFFPDAKSIVAGDADGTVHFFSFERPRAEWNPNFYE